MSPARAIRIEDAEVRILPDAAALARAAADEFVRAGCAAIAAGGRFTVALAGGSTPRTVFQRLAAGQATGGCSLDWGKVQVFFGDERPVPPDHSDSNFRMANEALLSQVPVPPQNIHRIEGEREPVDAAKRYESGLRSVFQMGAAPVPRFDLIMLGMGPDGHTASLFPGSTALAERDALVCATWVEKFRSHRITFTYPLINAAAEILFVAGGSDKAAMLGQVLQGESSGLAYPAQGIRPANGRLLWLVDEAASAQLKSGPPGRPEAGI